MNGIWKCVRCETNNNEDQSLCFICGMSREESLFCERSRIEKAEAVEKALSASKRRKKEMNAAEKRHEDRPPDEKEKATFRSSFDDSELDGVKGYKTFVKPKKASSAIKPAAGKKESHYVDDITPVKEDLPEESIPKVVRGSAYNLAKGALGGGVIFLGISFLAYLLSYVLNASMVNSAFFGLIALWIIAEIVYLFKRKKKPKTKKKNSAADIAILVIVIIIIIPRILNLSRVLLEEAGIISDITSSSSEDVTEEEYGNG